MMMKNAACKHLLNQGHISVGTANSFTHNYDFVIIESIRCTTLEVLRGQTGVMVSTCLLKSCYGEVNDASLCWLIGNSSATVLITDYAAFLFKYGLFVGERKIIKTIMSGFQNS